MSTYLQLVQKVFRECGVSGSEPTTVINQTGMTKKIVEWVADADEYVQLLHSDWNFLWSQHSDSTIIGTKDYTKPADHGSWDRDSFYLDYTASTYKKLAELKYKDWRTAFRNGTKTNNKSSFFVIKPDNNIILESPPDAVYTLTADYWKVATRLSGNTDTSNIPTRFERVIVARAKMWYGEFDDAPEVYTAGEKEFYEQLMMLEFDQLPNRDVNNRGDTSDMDMTVLVA